MVRRMLVFALIAVFAAVLAGGCSDTQEETIEYTIRDYYAAYNAEDWEMCLGHIDDTNNAGATVIKSALKESRAATGKVTVNSIENINISGQSATADITLSWAGKTGGETQKRTLVKKAGDWKISYLGG
jgi:hypothetical protein